MANDEFNVRPILRVNDHVQHESVRSVGTIMKIDAKRNEAYVQFSLGRTRVPLMIWTPMRYLRKIEGDVRIAEAKMRWQYKADASGVVTKIGPIDVQLSEMIDGDYMLILSTRRQVLSQTRHSEDSAKFFRILDDLLTGGA